jgi:hypothetical protein
MDLQLVIYLFFIFYLFIYLFFVFSGTQALIAMVTIADTDPYSETNSLRALECCFFGIQFCITPSIYAWVFPLVYYLQISVG